MINIANVSRENLLSFVLKIQPGVRKLNKKIDLLELKPVSMFISIPDKSVVHILEMLKKTLKTSKNVRL